MTAATSADVGSGPVPAGVTTAPLPQRLRRSRGLLLVALLVVVASVLLALAQSSRQRGLLDPAATDRSGSAALAALLGDQGVQVVRVTDARSAARELTDAVGPTTLLVAPTAIPSEAMLDAVSAVRSTYRVLVTPEPETLDALAPWARADGFRASGDETAPGCGWDVAQRAGPLPATGPTYSSDASGVTSCWEGGVLDRQGVGLTTTVVGSSSAFTNDALDESGNAALTLGVLGRAPVVVWWLPSATDPLQRPPDVETTVGDLVPPWVALAVGQVGVAVLLAVWWRGRRLGRVVLEPLPVTVRSTEAVEGRARLYRRGNARQRAAAALRAATAERLRVRLSLPRGTDVVALVPAVAARTGRDPAQVAALLAPATETLDDASLTRLATELDILENEVRHA